ncbi:hypothetical protein MTR_1g072865 [Medicago truncatula]|uniref:Uncharacterized protein n=1 Tax=Medicago truncatula TaxID=3880 RepID=A0A072VKU6_MEDTR|nr:hypothetical protein MTR_1g072865 [Medicago truncatula]
MTFKNSFCNYYLPRNKVYHKKSELVYCRQDESMAMAWPEVFVTEIILALKEVYVAITHLLTKTSGCVIANPIDICYDTPT